MGTFLLNKTTSAIMENLQPFTGSVRIESVPTKIHETFTHPASYEAFDLLTEPVNQGLCGSCWAISTTQCMRDRINRAVPKASRIPALSFQFVIDCAKNCVTFQGREGCAVDCNGGFLVTAYKFLQVVGTPRETYHPNRHVDENGEDHIDGTVGKALACPKKVACTEILYKCSGFYNVQIYPDMFGITNARTQPKFKSPKQLLANAKNIAEEIYLNGSVAVCFNLYSDFKPFWLHPNSKNMVYEIGWQLPKNLKNLLSPVGNVFWTAQNGPNGIHFKTGHSVSIVGYGSQKGSERDANGNPVMVDYWVCRNSWGPASNTYHNGYFKIRRGINSSAIESDVGACTISADIIANMKPKCETKQPLQVSSAVIPVGAPNTKTAISPIVIVAMVVLLMLALIMSR
jgi:hypothetical protein